MIKSQPRYLESQVIDDLKRKMVFLGGPRQVGKTTLGKSLFGGLAGYMNWDSVQGKRQILQQKFPDSPLWFFDEIHKFKKWRNYLKGLYDTKDPKQKILISGSARLDLYRYGGDSLQGRYHFLRLHPLTVAELNIKTEKELLELLQLGGFPEPYFSSSEKFSKRWSLEYHRRVIEEDVAQLENLNDLDSLQLLSSMLPSIVGGLLSINSLSEELSYSFKTVAKWVTVLEKVYSLFRILPFGFPSSRALKKSQKLYFFDWTVVKNPGSRFENMIACHLLKWAHYREDTEGIETSLKYFRDDNNREVDFVLEEEGRPLIFVECKLQIDKISTALKYLKLKNPKARACQIHLSGEEYFKTAEGIEVMPAIEFLKSLI